MTPPDLDPDALEKAAKLICCPRGCLPLTEDHPCHAYQLSDITANAIRCYLANKPPSTESAAMDAATAAVFDRFSGGSSGLDDIAEAIARDHATAAIRAYLTAREPGVASPDKDKP